VAQAEAIGQPTTLLEISANYRKFRQQSLPELPLIYGECASVFFVSFLILVLVLV